MEEAGRWGCLEILEYNSRKIWLQDTYVPYTGAYPMICIMVAGFSLSQSEFPVD